MKSRRQLYFLIPAITLLTACSTTPSQYVIEPDYEYIQKVEASNKFSVSGNRVYWVNPPMKREPLPEKHPD